MEYLAQVNIGPTFGSPFQDFGSLVTVIVSNAYIIAGIILLFLMVFGGIGIIAGAGGGNPEQTSKGKQAFMSAVIGFLIIFTSYWIIQLIQVVTGINILKPGF